MKYEPALYTGFGCMVDLGEEGRDFGVVLEDLGEMVKVLSDEGYSYTR